MSDAENLQRLSLNRDSIFHFSFRNDAMELRRCQALHARDMFRRD